MNDFPRRCVILFPYSESLHCRRCWIVMLGQSSASSFDSSHPFQPIGLRFSRLHRRQRCSGSKAQHRVLFHISMSKSTWNRTSPMEHTDMVHLLLRVSILVAPIITASASCLHTYEVGGAGNLWMPNGDPNFYIAWAAGITFYPGDCLRKLHRNTNCHILLYNISSTSRRAIPSFFLISITSTAY